MGQRRMFSNRIANSARFLQMPTESQLVYFHLVLRADDDGIVESYPIMKLLGVPTDAFKILLAKGLVQQLNEDQVVVIVDWLEHNVIRADRKTDSIYKHLLPEHIKTVEAKPRSDVKDNSIRIGGPSTVSISKDKLSQGKISEAKKSKDNPITNVIGENPDKRNTEIQNLWEFGLEAGLSSTKQNLNRYAIKRLLRDKTSDQLKKAVEFSQLIRQQSYAPQVNNWMDLEDKYLKLRDFVQRQNNKVELKVSRTIVL